VLTRLLRDHLTGFTGSPAHLLFRGVQGRPLVTITYRRAWDKARMTAFTDEEYTSALARRPYDLRQADQGVRLCRIERVALVHAYAEISMIIRCPAIPPWVYGKRLNQSQGGRSPITCVPITGVGREVDGPDHLALRRVMGRFHGWG